MERGETEGQQAMCWNPGEMTTAERSQAVSSDGEASPQAGASYSDATAPTGAALSAESEPATPTEEPPAAASEQLPESIASRRGRLSLFLRLIRPALAAASVFAAGFFVHATVNWPDFHKGPQVLDIQKLQQKVTPYDGVTVQANWGDLLPQLVSAGVIDVAKFKSAAAQSGQPLTDDQVRLLAEGGDDAIHIDMHNAKFVLNALWAVGLATDSNVLRDGPMARQRNGAANLASTGGWTLGKQAGPSYLGKLQLVSLTDEQQRIVSDVAAGVYRPCCNNPTSFPDCNHGMAALGLAEIMASQGASADEIFVALRSFNAYWFPDQYLTLAVYYKQRGVAWEKVNPRELLDGQHSSGSGFKQIDAAVKEESPLLPKSGGGGCSA